MVNNIVLSLIAFFLPTQLGLHFWPQFTRVNSLKIDYLSPTLYFVDILILVYCLVNFEGLKKIFADKKKLSILLLFVLINISLSFSPLLALFSWLKNLYYFVFFLLLVGEKSLWQKTRKSFICSISFLVALQVFQFINQGSLGGFFYWFGERLFTASTPNTGKVYLLQSSFVRPISTFSHANSLSGYLLVSLFLLKIHKEKHIILAIAALGVILTFSKIGILVLFLILFLNKGHKKLIIATIIFSLVQIVVATLPNAPQYVADRQYLISLYKNIPLQKFIFGVGLSNYIPHISQYISPSMSYFSSFQPVHNLPLLLVAEVGLVGVSLLIYLFLSVKRLNPLILPFLLVVLLTGSVDHYWLTLTQNKLILLFALALIV